MCAQSVPQSQSRSVGPQNRDRVWRVGSSPEYSRNQDCDELGPVLTPPLFCAMGPEVSQSEDPLRPSRAARLAFLWKGEGLALRNLEG